MNVSKEAACATLRSYGIDLLALAADIGAGSITIHCSSEGDRDIVMASAFDVHADQPAVATSWVITEVAA